MTYKHTWKKTYEKKTMVSYKSEEGKGKTKQIELKKWEEKYMYKIYTKITKSLGVVMNMIFW